MVYFLFVCFLVLSCVMYSVGLLVASVKHIERPRFEVSVLSCVLQTGDKMVNVLCLINTWPHTVEREVQGHSHKIFIGH